MNFSPGKIEFTQKMDADEVFIMRNQINKNEKRIEQLENLVMDLAGKVQYLILFDQDPNFNFASNFCTRKPSCCCKKCLQD